MLTARSDIPYDKRIEVARFIEDLTASYQAGWYSLISLHGGGSPEAMKLEIWRNYPIGNKVDLVERLLDRGVLADATRKITRNRQPGTLLRHRLLRARRAADGRAAAAVAKRRGVVAAPRAETARRRLTDGRAAVRAGDRRRTPRGALDRAPQPAAHRRHPGAPRAAHPDGDAMIARSEALLAAARRFGVPAWSPSIAPSRSAVIVAALREQFDAGDIFVKTRFGATDHPEFDALLRAHGRPQIVVAGMEAHVCVLQTVLGLAALGLRRLRRRRCGGLARPRGRTIGATRSSACAAPARVIAGTETVLFEWTHAGDDAAFRDVLALVKSLPPADQGTT